MKTLRIGDKGDEVKKLQKLLKINADGVFGAQTEKAVKDFQWGHGLEMDGIVGEKTWRALGIKNDSKCVDPSVIYAPLKSCLTKTPNRKIAWIAIHYTAGASSAPGRAIHMKDSWEKTRRASADFGVDSRDMVQFNPNPKEYYAWAVGDKKNPYGGGGSLYGIATNRNTISIEICSDLRKGTNASKPNHSGWSFSKSTLDNAVKLTKILMKKYNIDIDHVVRHYDISGKLCPGLLHWNKGPIYTDIGNKTSQTNDESEWLAFKARLKD